MYCLRCKKRTETLNAKVTTLRNGRPAKQGTCTVCGAKKSQLLSAGAFEGAGLLNSALNALPLPEMHMRLPREVPSEDVPGGAFQNTGKYSYAGPYTKLDKRLSQGYRGVNKLDRACLDHDVAYAIHSDTAGRNTADDVLAAAASKIALDDSVPDWERKDARTVAAIMSAKARLGMGIGARASPSMVGAVGGGAPLRRCRRICSGGMVAI
jgi:hypothetical protein